MDQLWEVKVKLLKVPGAIDDGGCQVYTEAPFEDREGARRWADEVIDVGLWVEQNNGAQTYYPPTRIWLVTVRRHRVAEDAKAKRPTPTAVALALKAAGL